jgi:hypothetical protein
VLRPRSICLASLAFAAVTGCTVAGGDATPCSGKCDDADDLEDALEGRADPIAAWIRTQEVAKDGAIQADYQDILFGLQKGQGCAESSVRTFVVSDDLVTGKDPFPRFISAVCGDDPVKASEFFIAASFEKFVGDGEATGEVDTRSLEMFAWDATARTYRFYATEPVGEEEDSGIRFEVEPARCRGCHLTPTDLAAEGMPMTPIMNELTRPWTHWNAQPGFESQEFEVPERVADSASFKELTGKFLAPASEFEQIIRAGHDRVALTRMRVRRDKPGMLRAGMDLLRPVFCEEQVSYVSEEGKSGILAGSAVIDPGMRALFQQVASDWPWDWINVAQLRMSSTSSPVSQVPVRGNADAVTETQLAAVGVLTARQLIQVRALDWQRPVFSSFRCGLWKGANERFDDDAPDLSDAADNGAAARILFDAIMTVDRTRLASGDDDQIIAVPLADDDTIEAMVAALEGDGLADADCADDGFCALDLDGLGAAIDAYVTGFQSSSSARTRLKAMRTERICEILRAVSPADDRFEGEDLPIRFSNRPSLPSVSCD